MKEIQEKDIIFFFFIGAGIVHHSLTYKRILIFPLENYEFFLNDIGIVYNVFVNCLCS